MAYATSNFGDGKVNSSLPLKFDAIFKQQQAIKVPIHLEDKINRFLDILEQYKIISPVKKTTTTKRKYIYNSRYYSS